MPKPNAYPRASTLHKDTGFQGSEPTAVDSRQPTKKPRGKELTAGEKRHNRALARVRVKVEHAISGIKRSRCVKDTLRNTQPDCSDRFMVVAAGLHNLRVRRRKHRLRR